MRTMIRDGRAYHTAIEKGSKVAEGEGTIEFMNDRVHAYVHNIHDGYDDRWSSADVIYTEPAWRTGYAKFMRSAGQSPEGYDEYLDDIRRACLKFGKPAYVVAGKSMLRTLKPHFSYPVKLSEHGCDAYICVYNFEDLTEDETNTALIRRLCGTYKTICDINCGCGNLLAFANPDNSFIFSDVNAECIGYIRNMEESR